MKHKFTKNDIMIIITTIILIILLVLIVVLASKGNKKEDKAATDGYVISDEVVELPGTNIFTSDALNATKCIDDICTSNVKIYASEGIGRVECDVTNNTDKVADGYLKLTAGELDLLIAYVNVNPGETKKVEAGYGNLTLTNADDYSIRVLTPEEEAKIIK